MQSMGQGGQGDRESGTIGKTTGQELSALSGGGENTQAMGGGWVGGGGVGWGGGPDTRRTRRAESRKDSPKRKEGIDTQRGKQGPSESTKRSAQRNIKRSSYGLGRSARKWGDETLGLLLRLKRGKRLPLTLRLRGSETLMVSREERGAAYMGKFKYQTGKGQQCRR